MAANNLGTAYIKIAPQMDGIQSSIANALKSATASGSSVSTAAIAVGNVISKGISVAMSAVTSSIDTAIRRTDIINNFPKVMSNIGISAEDSQKSIDLLVKKLDGLPTSLQAGASAVQRFTSANGDVQKSTDIFLALNNAILAGGASAEIQASALEQVSQAYAKGKPDMMEWRTMMMAMPAQMRQLSEAMGYGADGTANLGEALRKGEVSMDSFMDTIVRLNKEGTGKFKSFEKQARNATDGIGTAMTNVRNRIAAAIEKIINAFGSRDISSAINNFSAGFGKVADWIAQNVVPIIKNTLIPVMKNVLTVISNIVKFVADNKWVQDFLVTVLNTLIAFKAVTAIKTAIMGIVAPIVSMATNLGGAVSAFSAAHSAGMAFSSAMGAAATSSTGLTSKIASLAAALGPVGLVGAAGAAAGAIMVLQAQMIATEIKTTKATTAAREYARKHYDVATAVRVAEKAAADLEGQIESLSEAEQSAADFELAAIQARQDQARYQEELNRLTQEGKQATDEYREAELLLQKATLEEKDANDKLAATQENIASIKERIADLNYADLTNTNLRRLEIMKENLAYGDMAASLDALSQATIRYTDEQGNMVEMTKEKQAEWVQALADMAQRGDDNWKHINQIAQEQGISFVDAAIQYGTEAGTDFMQFYKEGVDSRVPLVTDATTEAGKKAIAAAKDESAKAYGVGEGLLEGITKGVTAPQSVQKLLTKFSGVINQAIERVKQVAQEHSPSKRTAEIGKFLTLGLAQGIEDYADEAINAAKDVSEATLDAFDMNGTYSQGATQFAPQSGPAGAQNGSGGQVTQYNNFTINDELDAKEISKRLGWQVATAL